MKNQNVKIHAERWEEYFKEEHALREILTARAFSEEEHRHFLSEGLAESNSQSSSETQLFPCGQRFVSLMIRTVNSRSEGRHFRKIPVPRNIDPIPTRKQFQLHSNSRLERSQSIRKVIFSPCLSILSFWVSVSRLSMPLACTAVNFEQHRT